jgi:hypothetical protein
MKSLEFFYKYFMKTTSEFCKNFHEKTPPPKKKSTVASRPKILQNNSKPAEKRK